MKKIFSFIATLMLLFSPLMASSVSALRLGEALRLNDEQAIEDSPVSTPGGLISIFIKNAYIIAGFIFIIVIIYTGFMWVQSAGNPQEIEKHKDSLIRALIGATLVLTSYWILEIIQVVTGMNILNGGFLQQL